MTYAPFRKKRLTLYVFWCCVHWWRHDQQGNPIKHFA